MSQNNTSHKTAREFPSQEALKDYLSKHPKADRRKHTVKSEDGEKGSGSGPSKAKDDAHFKGQWADALSRNLGRPVTDDDMDVLKGQMKQFVQKEKSKDKPVFDKRPEKSAPKLDMGDSFNKQWADSLSTQLGRPATQDDMDILKGKMKQFVQRSKTASSAGRVMFRYIASTD